MRNDSNCTPGELRLWGGLVPETIRGFGTGCGDCSGQALVSEPQGARKAKSLLRRSKVWLL